MPRTVRVTVTGNPRGVDFNFTAVRFQRMRLWVAAKIRETDKLRAGGVFWHFDQRIPLPKLGEWRQRHLLASPTLPGNVVKSLQPFQLAFAFGKSLISALLPAFTQLGKDIKIISRFILRRYNLLHRHQMLVAVIAGHGQIITLKRRRRRQHDIGMLRCGCPETL